MDYLSLLIGLHILLVPLVVGSSHHNIVLKSFEQAKRECRQYLQNSDGRCEPRCIQLVLRAWRSPSDLDQPLYRRFFQPDCDDTEYANRTAQCLDTGLTNLGCADACQRASVYWECHRDQYGNLIGKPLLIPATQTLLKNTVKQCVRMLQTLDYDSHSLKRCILIREGLYGMMDIGCDGALERRVRSDLNNSKTKLISTDVEVNVVTQLGNASTTTKANAEVVTIATNYTSALPTLGGIGENHAPAVSLSSSVNITNPLSGLATAACLTNPMCLLMQFLNNAVPGTLPALGNPPTTTTLNTNVNTSTSTSTALPNPSVLASIVNPLGAIDPMATITSLLNGANSAVADLLPSINTTSEPLPVANATLIAADADLSAAATSLLNPLGLPNPLETIAVLMNRANANATSLLGQQ